MPEFTGTLDHLVVIEQSTDAQNTFGEPVPTWSTFASVWAHVAPISGAEPFVAAQFLGVVDHRITTPYQSQVAGVKPKMRVRWNSRVFNVLAVLNRDERNERLDLLAKEIL